MKLRIEVEVDCTAAARVLAEAGVPGVPELLADEARRRVGLWLASEGSSLGLFHGDPVTGLPEVAVTVESEKA
jgi:hypothetical protein